QTIRRRRAQAVVLAADGGKPEVGICNRADSGRHVWGDFSLTSLTIRVCKATKDERYEPRIMLRLLPDNGRPRTRRECPEMRPCPWVSCKHNTACDVSPTTGTIKLPFGVDIDDWPEENCVLTLAERSGMIHEEIAAVMGITRERSRQ